MKIGIDASRTFVENPTGTERYAYEITTKMLQLPEAKKHQWILYIKPGLNLKIRFSNVKIVPINMAYLWTQVGMAYRTWVDNLDVLWVPAHTLPILRKPGIKTVVTIHGMEYEWLPAYENPLQRWYLPLSTIYASKTATKVIAVSEFTKKQMVERIGVDKNKIEVIYEGFEPTKQVSKIQTSVFEKYGIKPGKYLLFVGTIQPRKNLERLIEAFATIKTDLKLVIAGKWGWLNEEVKKAPIKFGVEDRVVFTGYIKDTERYILLANAMVYVQSSITEGFGLPVLEAMAAGVPVVSSSGGALKEILKLKKNTSAGLMFDPYKVDDIKTKIKMMISDKKLRLEMIKRGKIRANDFSWLKAANLTYNTLLNL